MGNLSSIVPTLELIALVSAAAPQVVDARGEDRVAAMADVIGILIEERAAMQRHCADKHAMMTK